MRINCELGLCKREILETALHNYYQECMMFGNPDRAECVSNLRKLLFNDGVGYGD